MTDYRTKRERREDVAVVSSTLFFTFVILLAGPCGFSWALVGIGLVIAAFCGVAAYYGVLSNQDHKELLLRQNAEALRGRNL